MKVEVIRPMVVRFTLSPSRFVEVIIYGHEARLMAYGLTNGERIPTSLFESEIEGFIREAKKTLNHPSSSFKE